MNDQNNDRIRYLAPCHHFQVANTNIGNPIDTNAFYAENNTNFTSSMFINSSGNVGIGTTNPSSSYKLDVNGKINCTDISATNAVISGKTFRVDFGSATPPSSGFNGYQAFSTTFSSAPFVVASHNTTNTNAIYGVQIKSISTSGFYYNSMWVIGTTISGAGETFNWIAIGS